MEPERPALKVCVCGATENQVTMLLHALANGQIFGPTQPVRLTLHDSAEKACEVMEEAADLQDACYPLLMGVEAKTNVDQSLCGSGIILLVLQTTALHQLMPTVADYADALNRTPRIKQKAIVVVSYHAVPAAAILCVLAPQLSHHLVTAVELPPLFLKLSQMGKGGLLLVNKVSKHVSSWWSGLLTKDCVSQVARFRSFPMIPMACLLPLSMRTARNEEMARTSSEEREHFKQDLQDFLAALTHLQINNAQLFSSALSCQL